MTPRRGTGPIPALFAAILLVLSPRALAAEPTTPPPDFWAFPPSAVAYCAVDPQLFGAGPETDPARGLIEAGLCGLINHTLPLDRPGPIDLARFLAPSILGSSPYRVCLLSIEPAEAGKPGGISNLSAIIEIRAPLPDHPRLAGGLQAALDRGASGIRRAAATQSPITLANSTAATRFSRAGEPPWRTIEWCSTDSAFLVGIGQGTLDSWLATPATSSSRPEWSFHRNLITRAHPRTDPIVEAYVDLNAFRIALPDELASGPMSRLLNAWRIPNARGIMLHARMPMAPNKSRRNESQNSPPPGPPLMSLDLSYSSRAEPPGTVHSLAISQSEWPPDLGAIPLPTAGLYAIILRADWPTWTLMGLDTFSALAPSTSPRATQPDRWLRRAGAALQRAANRAGPWVVIVGAPPSTGESRPIAFATALDPAGDKNRLDNDLRVLFASLGEEVRRDSRSGIWTLTLSPEDADHDRRLRSFSWGLTPDGSRLRGAWTPAALESASKPPR